MGFERDDSSLDDGGIDGVGFDSAADDVEDAQEEAQIFNLLYKGADDRLVKRTPKEETLQGIARSLVLEYGFDLGDLERAFSVRLTTVSQATGRERTRRVKVDVAAFIPGSAHVADHVIRAGLIVPAGTRPDDEKKGLAALDDVLGALPACEVGFWTNGTELAFRRKVIEGSEPAFSDIGGMPAAGEDLASLADQKLRRRLIAVSSETLAQTFRRCHDYIHANQGMNKSQAFWELVRLTFCKMYDEQRELLGREREFWVGLTERFTPEGQAAIKQRLTHLFEEVQGKGSVPSPYSNFFSPDETIGLHDPVLAYVAGELSRYELLNSSEDAKGAAYEEIIDKKQKADRGQFFTPRNVIRVMVELLDPDESDYVLDPACGTGGFLVMVFRHVSAKIEARLQARWAKPGTPTESERMALRDTQRQWASEHLVGFDFDRDLVKATKMNLAMNGGDGQIHWIDSLKFPDGQTSDLQIVRDRYPLGRVFTLCFTNPPFGSKLPFNDRAALANYGLARADLAGRNGRRAQVQSTFKRSVAPEILFIERCVQWVQPGGRIGIVLPDGILGNPGDVHIRRWILERCHVLASIDLPVETFLPQVGVQPSLLFLQKKTSADLDAEALGTVTDLPVFMAIVDKVGKDRRGNLIYKRNPDGTEVAPVVRLEHHVATRDGHEVLVEIPFEELPIDDELPEVADAWRSYRSGRGQ